MRVGKLSGAVGTYSATDPEVERVACERLGLEPAPSSTQILQRDRHAELLSTLALVAASLEKFALEIRHLARDRGGRGSGAIRPRAKGLLRDAAQAKPGRRRADLRAREGRPRRRDGRARERGAVARARYFALLRRAGGRPGCLPGARLHARSFRLARRRPGASAPSGCGAISIRATASFSASACCSHSSNPGSPATRRTGSSSVTPFEPGTRSRTSASSSGPTGSSPAASISTPSSTSSAYTRHVDCRLRAAALARPEGGDRPCLKPHTSEAGRSGSFTRWTTNGSCSSQATGFRPSTSFCRPRYPTRGAC